MAFFADLTPHTYSPTGGLEILNIGWLDEGRPFPVGPTSQKFQEILHELCQHPILLHRGFHLCWFCRQGKLKDEKEGDLRLKALAGGPEVRGNGQIRVLGKNGIWYAAPTLVHHYVTQHAYCPPTEFINAVLSPVAVGTDYGWFPDIPYSCPRKK